MEHTGMWENACKAQSRGAGCIATCARKTKKISITSGDKQAMKRLTLAALLMSAFAAHAQSNVTIYGIVDSSVRYTTNQNAAGGSKIEQTDGILSGSRIGFKGVEDLGGGLKANFVLEAGINPDTGASGQGGRLFGRQSTVGLSGSFGNVLLGRKYTVAHEMMTSYEAMFFANQAIVGYQGGNYTGLRQDNQVQYNNKFGDISVALGHTFGEQAGSFTRSSTNGATLGYDSGPLHLGSSYQVMNGTTTEYFGVANPASKQKVWSVGGTYQLGIVKYYLGYTNNQLDVADYRNNVYYAGANVTLTPTLSLIGTYTHDKMTHASTTGVRNMGAVMLDYFLSKRTDIYIEADYNKFSGAWSTLASTTGFSTPMYGNNSRVGMMVGVRHMF
jgi:predicted porin